jgi:hypothetical protein
MGDREFARLAPTPNNTGINPRNERYSSLQTHCSNGPRSQATHHKPRELKQFIISVRTDAISSTGQSCHAACHGDSGGKDINSYTHS